jgi:hypothetical protein
VAALQPIGDALMRAFVVTEETDLGRVVRVTGALGAVAVARVALREHMTADALGELVDVGLHALGHTGPVTSR